MKLIHEIIFNPLYPSPTYKLKLHVDKMALLKYLQKIDKPKDKEEDCDVISTYHGRQSEDGHL